MAIVHSDPPQYFGERKLAAYLASLGDPLLHLWFDISYLADVYDIDCLVWHEVEGVFLVEVKAIPLDWVEFLDLKSCKIRDRDRGPSPAYQANKAKFKLLQFLRKR